MTSLSILGMLYCFATKVLVSVQWRGIEEYRFYRRNERGLIG